jgi:hypothetical protein
VDGGRRLRGEERRSREQEDCPHTSGF